MTESADVVVIGAGFAGAATAYHLTARGVRDVLVLEAEPTAGVHASGKNAALCFQLIADREEARLAVEGTRIFAVPPADLAASPLLARSGSLLVASAARRPALESSLRHAEALGVAASLLPREEALRLVPLLAGAPFEVALLDADDGVVDIARLLEGYLEAARRRGARVRFGERVTAIRAPGSVESVRTTRGTIATRRVVNAAGPWAGEIGVLAGVGDRTIAPRRRHIFRIERAHGGVDPRWPFVWHDEIDVYVRPERGGLLTSPCDATPHPVAAPAIDAAAEPALHAKLAGAFPAIGEARVVEARACLRTFAADERFVIGADPALGGLVWAAALGGHGMSTSFGVGRMVADAVLGEARSDEARRFDPGRFDAAAR